MNEKVEKAYDSVIGHFNSQIAELSNNEMELLLTDLIAKFEGLLEQVQEATRNEQ